MSTKTSIADAAGAVEPDPHAVTMIASKPAAGIPQRVTDTPDYEPWATRPYCIQVASTPSERTTWSGYSPLEQSLLRFGQRPLPRRQQDVAYRRCGGALGPYPIRSEVRLGREPRGMAALVVRLVRGIGPKTVAAGGSMTGERMRSVPVATLGATLVLGILIGGGLMVAFDRATSTGPTPSTSGGVAPIAFTRVVRAWDFDANWPFTVRSVLLSCEAPHTVVFTSLDGTKYGLDGVMPVYSDVEAIVSPDGLSGKANLAWDTRPHGRTTGVVPASERGVGARQHRTDRGRSPSGRRPPCGTTPAAGRSRAPRGALGPRDC
jgi:hypothetical protein